MNFFLGPHFDFLILTVIFLFFAYMTKDSKFSFYELLSIIFGLAAKVCMTIQAIIWVISLVKWLWKIA